MSQQATNPKIEELRGRLKADPKSRLFYQLAEELRKVKGFAEAEEVLRSGLSHNPTYLAAWMSFGRVLREENKHRDAVDAFARALQLDPGNAVAARLMADTFYAMGEKIEAIKKYKLARALMPADDELDALIDRIDDEINPITLRPPVVTAELPKSENTLPGRPAAFASLPQPPQQGTGDAEPMRAAHEESPFEEPASAYSSAAIEVEQPAGMHVEPAPPQESLDEDRAAEVFEPAASAPVPTAEDVANTITMADLYVQQGFPDRAQSIYMSILDRDPNNDAVRAKLEALEAPPPPAPQTAEESAPAKNAKAAKLEKWLTKVKREERRA